MAFDPEDNVFLLPGPVKMHSRVLRAMARPALAHRGPAFTEVNQRLFAGLRRLMDAPHVAVLTGSGTAGMEAAVSNLVHWGDPAVGVDTGKFGQRMADLVERCAGEKAVRLEAPWGRGIDPEQVEAALEEGAAAVAFTLNETSTATVNPGPEIARLCRRHGALSIADTVTATGSVPVPLEAWGLDVSVVGSQKCIGGPAGLSFVGLSRQAMERLDSPSLYLDLRRHVARHEKDGQTPFTPAVPLHLACVEALDLVFEEGLEARYARTRRLAEGCRAAAEAAGLELAAEAGHRSDTVTAIRYPEGVKDTEVRRLLQERFGVVVAGAQGAWKGQVFRMGHMAGTTWTELAAGWAAVEGAFAAAGRPLPRGAAVRALMDHAPEGS